MRSEEAARSLKMADYTYNLPDERIAKFPLSQRDESRLLIYQENIIREDKFSSIEEWLPSESMLVFNNTKVLPARLLFRTSTGAHIEVLCLSPLNPPEYELSLAARERTEWLCMVGNLKKWRERTLRLNLSPEVWLDVERSGESTPEGVPVLFSWKGDLAFSEVLELAGHMPIPPYLNREDMPEDQTRYQTVYSLVKGSVAAPTAGLHFTENVLNRLSARGFGMTSLTLHVGAGTFRPVKSDSIGDHRMHEEWFLVSQESLKSIIGRSVIAVGTTSARTLESLYILGRRVIEGRFTMEETYYIGQWEGYQEGNAPSGREALEALLLKMELLNIDFLRVSTAIIIVPGYRFMVVKGLITNYHQPGSTLLLLVAALIGPDWKRVYDYALDNGFRFLSYGDSSLLLP